MTERVTTGQLFGVGLSEGVGIGTAYALLPRGPAVYRLCITPDEAAAELERFHEAVAKSKRQLSVVRKKLAAEVGKEQAYIIDAHRLILQDRQFISGIEQKIAEKLESPERAVWEAAEQWLSVYRSVRDPFFRERGSDLEEVVDRIIANLVKLDRRSSPFAGEDLILVGDSISLSVLADFGLDKIRGLVSTRGGETSHLTIVARSRRIPVVAGIEGVTDLVKTGQRLVVDGSRGIVHVEPDDAETARFRVLSLDETRQNQTLVGDSRPVETCDGRRVIFFSNTEAETDVMSGLRLGAEGIGLYRSEYAYMQRKDGPVEEREQYEIYAGLAAAAGDRPAIVRTLDIGDEGHPFFARLAGEAEPVLGLRGIRLSLKYPEIFTSQIRAILRAGEFGNLKILLPMVSCAGEVIETRKLIDAARRDLEQEGCPVRNLDVGAMLEIPGAVYALEGIADQVDFLSVGTNDLIQYTLAVGRSNQRISHLFNPYHPAILHSLVRIARLAGQRGMMAVICGEVASSPVFSQLLVGMGFQHLSMNPYAIPALRESLRQVSYAESRATVEALLELHTAADIERVAGERCRPPVGFSSPAPAMEPS